MKLRFLELRLPDSSNIFDLLLVDTVLMEVIAIALCHPTGGGLSFQIGMWFSRKMG